MLKETQLPGFCYCFIIVLPHVFLCISKELYEGKSLWDTRTWFKVQMRRGLAGSQVHRNQGTVLVMAFKLSVMGRHKKRDSLSQETSVCRNSSCWYCIWNCFVCYARCAPRHGVFQVFLSVWVCEAFIIEYVMLSNVERPRMAHNA